MNHRSARRPVETSIVFTIGLLIATAVVWPGVRAQAPGPPSRAADDGLALTPPMGWYPWNTFGQDLQNERLIQEMAAAVVSRGLREAGYSYVGPDEGICFSRATDGSLTSNLARYPSGLRGLGDYIHARGLKYALYTDAGTRTCSQAMPGTKGHEFDDMRSFAEWRCDYVKIDWCNTEGQDVIDTYSRLHDALRATGRPIVHSICSWGEGAPWAWAAGVAHLWRTTTDICTPNQADYAHAIRMVWANERLHAAAGPGHWNDPDMMIVGMPGLTDVQNRSLFSLWCMMAAPLMAGNDLRSMSKATTEVLTNLEAVGVDQDPLGRQGRLLWFDGDIGIWGGKRLFDGSQAVLVFNLADGSSESRITWADLGLDSKAACYVRDLWTHTTQGPLTGGVTVRVAAGNVAFLRVAPTASFPLPPILSADTYLVSLRTDEESARVLQGSLTVSNRAGTELPVWTVRSALPPWLSVKVTRNGATQTFVNTVSTAGLKKGSYHVLVRADNVEPRSGLPMTSCYYDIDLEVGRDVRIAAR
jgi:alpha-galactosidase